MWTPLGRDSVKILCTTHHSQNSKWITWPFQPITFYASLICFGNAKISSGIISHYSLLVRPTSTESCDLSWSFRNPTCSFFCNCSFIPKIQVPLGTFLLPLMKMLRNVSPTYFCWCLPLLSTSQTIQLQHGRRREEGRAPVLRQGEQGQHHHQTLPGPGPGRGVRGVTTVSYNSSATATITTVFSFQSFIFKYS